MQTIAQRYEAYKRGTIHQLKPFFEQGLVTITELENIAKNSARQFVLDHDCTASPEDGCSTCYELQNLGLIEDFDPLDFIDETDDWNNALRDHINCKEEE